MVIYAPLSLVLSSLHKRSEELKQSSTEKQSGFFLKISKQNGKVWGKSLTCAKQTSLTRP